MENKNISKTEELAEQLCWWKVAFEWSLQQLNSDVLYHVKNPKLSFLYVFFLKIHNDICFFLVGMEVSESTAEECKHSSVFSAALLRFAAEIRGVMNLWA